LLAIIFIRLLYLTIVGLFVFVFNCSRNQLKTGIDARSLNFLFIGLGESSPFLIPLE